MATKREVIPSRLIFQDDYEKNLEEVINTFKREVEECGADNPSIYFSNSGDLIYPYFTWLRRETIEEKRAREDVELKRQLTIEKEEINTYLRLREKYKNGVIHKTHD